MYIYQLLKTLDAPAVCLLPDHAFEPRVLKQEHVIVNVAISRLVGVVFRVLGVLRLLERVTLHVHFTPINDNFLVKRLGRDDVLHATHELEPILVQLFNVADSDGDVGILLFVFLEEGGDHTVEVTVFVDVLQMHGCLLLERLVDLAEHVVSGGQEGCGRLHIEHSVLGV